MTINIDDQWTVQHYKHKDRRVTFVDWRFSTATLLADQSKYSSPFFISNDEVVLTIDNHGIFTINFIPNSNQTLTLYLKSQRHPPPFTKAYSWNNNYCVSVKVLLGKHNIVYSKTIPVTYSANIIKKTITIGTSFSLKELGKVDSVHLSAIFMSSEAENLPDSLTEVRSPHTILRTLIRKFPPKASKNLDYSNMVNAGLTNPANLCYMNTVIQVLYNNISFREFIFGLQTTVGGTKTTAPLPNPSACLSFEFQKLFYALQNSQLNDVISCTSLLMNGLNYTSKDLDQQQDASEVMIRLLDKLRQENPHFQDLLDEIMTLALEEVSIYLSGAKEVIQEKTETVMPISIFEHSNLTSELNAFFSRSRKGSTPLGDGNIYNRISHCPKTLSFSLNRYEYKNGNFVKSNKKFSIPRKLNIFEYSSASMMFLPETPRRGSAHPTLSVSGTMARELRMQLSAVLSAKNEDASNEVYYLGAVISHSGCVSYGHYQAYINYFEAIPPNTKLDVKNNVLFTHEGVSYRSKWVNYNDSIVSHIAEKDFFDIIAGGQKLDASEEYFQNNAYMLFYLRFSEIKQQLSSCSVKACAINPILESAIQASESLVWSTISKEVDNKLYANIKVATPFSLHKKCGLGYLPINMLNNNNKLKISGLLLSAKLSHYQSLSHLCPMIKEDLKRFYKASQKTNNALLKEYGFPVSYVDYNSYNLQLRKFNVRKNGTIRPSIALKENIINQDIKTSNIWRADLAQYCVFASLSPPNTEPLSKSIVLIKGIFGRSIDSVPKDTLRVIGFIELNKSSTFEEILPELFKLYFIELASLDIPKKKLTKFINDYVLQRRFSIYEEISPTKLGAIDIQTTLSKAQIRDGDILVINPFSPLLTADVYAKLNEKIQVKLYEIENLDNIDSVIDDPIILEMDRNVMLGRLIHEITKASNEPGAVIYKPAVQEGQLTLKMARTKNTLGALLKEIHEIAVFESFPGQEKISVSSNTITLYYKFDPLSNIHTEVKFSWIGLNEPLPIYDIVCRIDPEISVTHLFDMVRSELLIGEEPSIQLFFLSSDESRIIKILGEEEADFRLDIALLNVSHVLVSMAVTPGLYTFILHNVDPLSNKCFKYPLVLPLPYTATVEDVRQALLAKYALARQRRIFESSVDPNCGFKLSGKEIEKLNFAFSIGPTITNRHFYTLPKLKAVEEWPIVIFNRTTRKIVPFTSSIVKDCLSRDIVLCVFRGKE